MKLETVRQFLLYCTLINYGVLILWSFVFLTGGDWHYRLTTRWFPTLTRERYDLVNLSGIAFYKIAVLVLNLVPFAALCLMGD